MSLQAGQLLIVRKHLVLEDGITSVDTGLTQVGLGVTPDPPLGGSDPTADSAGVASRVMVIPQAPLPPWNTSNIHHSEPYLDPTTGTVWVDFWVAATTGPAEINVDFWDPHTAVCPMACDVYNTFSCETPTLEASSAESGLTSPATVPNGATSGETLIVFMVVESTGTYDPTDEIVPVEAGWTVLRRASIDAGGGNGMHFAAFIRVATGADPVTYDFAFTDGGGESWQALPAIVTGANQAGPLQSDAAVVTNDTPATPFPLTAPSLAAVVPLPLLISFYACRTGGGGVWSVPTGMTAVIQNEPSGTISFFTCMQLIAAAGATGAKLSEYSDGSTEGFAYALLIDSQCGIFPGDIPDPMGIMGV